MAQDNLPITALAKAIANSVRWINPLLELQDALIPFVSEESNIDSLVSGYGLGIQRSNEVRVMDQQNTFWANTQHAVGLVLDGSTRYVDK